MGGADGPVRRRPPAGRLAELDWVCRATAYRAAIDAGLPLGLTLFVNAEPAALGVPCPPDLAATILDAQLRLRVVVEMTERAITDDPATLLTAAEACRGSGWGVALDDVGAEPASLAVMPFVHPDVVDPAEPPILLGCFQEARFLTAATVRRYATVARTAALVGVLGTEMPGAPVSGVPALRGAAIAGDDRCAASGTSWSSARTSPALSSRATSPTTDPTPTGGSPTPSRMTGGSFWRRPVRCCTGSCQHRRL